MTKLLSRRGEERGAMLILAALSMVVVFISAALAVDLGRLSSEKRVDQRIADLAALDAARHLPVPGLVKDAASESATRNGFTPTIVSYGLSGPDPDGLYVCLGTMVGDAFTDSSGTCNAGDVVRVQVQSAFSTAFPFVVGPSGVSASGVAQRALEPEAAFSVGSTLASLDTQRSALDGVLGGMLGETAAQMSVVSYDGLATGNVSLAALRTKLLAMGYAFGTPDDLLTQNIKVADMLTATSQVLADQGNTTAKAEVDKIIALTINTALQFTLGRLVSLDTPATDAALATNVNVFQLINGSAQIANGTNFVSVPGINVSLPSGLGNITTSVSVVEPAQVARGRVGVTARTSQVKVRLHVDLVQTGALALLAPVSLDIDYAAASAEARLSAIRCVSPIGIELNPTTSGVGIVLGGTILPPLAGTLTGSGSIAATPPPATRPFFDYPNEFAPPVGPSPAHVEHVGAASLGFSPAIPMTVTGSNGLLAPTVAAAVTTLLPTIWATANSTVAPLLRPVLQRLGLDLAGADLMALGIFLPPPDCGAPIGQPILIK